MDRSLGFGSAAYDSTRYSHSLSLRLRTERLSLARIPVTRRLIMQKARRQDPEAIGLRPLVSIWFQVLFHSPPGYFSPFRSRYWFTIGHAEYLALEGGPPRIHARFHRSALLGKSPAIMSSLSSTGLSPSMAGLSRRIPLR